MDTLETLIKKYGKRAIKLACDDLERNGKHAIKEEFEKLCKKYSDK